MAHTCPECSQYCTCNGDWDDIDFGEDLDCRHCPEETIDILVTDADVDAAQQRVQLTDGGQAKSEGESNTAIGN